MSSVRAASAAEAAATRKDMKYIEISRVHLFFPIAFEIMGPINQVGLDFISELQDVGFLHPLATHVKPLSYSNAFPSLYSVSILFHSPIRSTSHTLRAFTYRSTLKLS